MVISSYKTEQNTQFCKVESLWQSLKNLPNIQVTYDLYQKIESHCNRQ